MPEPARTQRYEGLFPSQTQEMFEADARQAAEQDWYPLSETWSGATLFVVYEHDPERRTRAPQPAQRRVLERDAPRLRPSRRHRRRVRCHPSAAKALTGILVGCRPCWPSPSRWSASSRGTDPARSSPGPSSPRRPSPSISATACGWSPMRSHLARIGRPLARLLLGPLHGGLGRAARRHRDRQHQCTRRRDHQPQ